MIMSVCGDGRSSERRLTPPRPHGLSQTMTESAAEHPLPPSVARVLSTFRALGREGLGQAGWVEHGAGYPPSWSRAGG